MSNIERNIDIFTAALNGASELELASQYKVTDQRIHQIFWEVVRLINACDVREGILRLPSIFAKEKYPQCWIAEDGSRERFSPRAAKLIGWRAEKEHILKLLDVMLSE